MPKVKALSFFILLIQSVAVGQVIGDNPSLLHNDNYIIKQYNSENGLPQNSAKDLLLDRNGFLWIATENGLVRFDGQRFRVYNTSNTPVLQTNRFPLISETLQRELLFRSDFDQSVIYKATPDYKIVIDSPATRLPLKLISYHSNGIFDPAPLFNKDKRSGGLQIDTLFLSMLLKSATYWVLNEKEAIIFYMEDSYYLNNASGEVIKLPVKLDHRGTQQAFLSNSVFGIFQNKGKILFFKKGRPANIKIDESVAGILKNDLTVPSPGLLIYTKGDLVIAKIYNDIYKLNIEKDTLKAQLLFKGLRFLGNQPFYSFQYDSSRKRLFVGTRNEGLFVISQKRFNTLTFRATDLNSNVFMASQILFDRRLLTNNGILDKADPNRNILFNEAGRIDRNCIYKSTDGRIWLSANSHLRIYDGNFSRKLVEDSFQLESPIITILEGSDQAVWISTASSLLKWENGKLRTVFDHQPPFTKHAIETMAEISPGIIWIGTRDGIYRYHMYDNKLEEKALLDHVYARNIFQARDKSIWIGTYGNGYLKYLNGLFIRLPLDSKRYMATAHTFAEDNNGFFWISTNHGLFRIEKSDLDSCATDSVRTVFFDYFDKSSGFNTNEFNGGCNPVSLKDQEGNFYFPSLNGVVYFNPDSVGLEVPDKGIFIDNFSVDSNRLDYRQVIRLNPDFNRIVINISTPFYGPEDNLRLEYKMDPIGGKWYPVEAGGRIIINRLPYGSYTLVIRKMNGFGKGNFTFARIPFEVLPDWYNTKLFRVLLAAAFICIAMLLFRLRTRILLRANVRLQIKVDERTLELEQSTALKEKLISVIMHDLRSPLFSLSSLISYLDGNYKKLGQSEVQEILGQLNESANDICQFSSDFLIWYNSQKPTFPVRRELIEFEEFAKETCAFYQDMAYRKGISLTYKITPGLVIFSDRNILAIIIRNLVDNAVKYTKSGSIHIIADRTDENIRMQVSDTGPGMTTEQIGELLSYSGKATDKITVTFGYRFITELLQKLEGGLSIVSEPGKGTLVIVTLRTLRGLPGII